MGGFHLQLLNLFFLCPDRGANVKRALQKQRPFFIGFAVSRTYAEGMGSD